MELLELIIFTLYAPEYVMPQIDATFHEGKGKLRAVRPKKIIPLFLRPLFEETDAGGRFFILIFI